MADLLALDLVERHMVTNQLVLTVGYDIENLSNPYYSKKYFGEIVTDFYGRKVPKYSVMIGKTLFIDVVFDGLPRQARLQIYKYFSD